VSLRYFSVGPSGLRRIILAIQGQRAPLGSAVATGYLIAAPSVLSTAHRPFGAN
jgi:hypothetical protein